MKAGMKVSLCGGRYWCPSIEFDGEKVILKDDKDATISYSKMEWNKLVSFIKNGKLSHIK